LAKRNKTDCFKNHIIIEQPWWSKPDYQDATYRAGRGNAGRRGPGATRRRSPTASIVSSVNNVCIGGRCRCWRHQSAGLCIWCWQRPSAKNVLIWMIVFTISLMASNISTWHSCVHSKQCTFHSWHICSS